MALLQSQGLPVSDITEDHLQHFFFVGSDGSPTGLVGVEIYSTDALLRSLVVGETARGKGLGSALVDHAERYAASQGAVFNHGESIVPVESTAAGPCCVRAPKAEPAASCCTP